ncbi:MAG: alpha/beta hydrolase [Thermoleophilaceae bacterium]
MQPLIEHPLELAGFETRALELEGDGPPVLLLHGFADSADTWRWVLDLLARENRGALALDMPGFGTCSPLREEEPILDQLDAFGRAALEYLARDRGASSWRPHSGGAVVCGNSLGGCVALRLSEDPDLGLAGIMPIAPAGLDMARWLRIIEQELGVRLVLAAPVPEVVVRTVIAEVYKRLAFRHPNRVDRRAIRTFASHLQSRATASRVLQSGRRVVPELRDPFRLERISCPVLLVWGEDDVMVFQTGAERVLEATPDARLELIEDCGHCPQLECPDPIAELLLEFSPVPAAGALARQRLRPPGLLSRRSRPERGS